MGAHLSFLQARSDLVAPATPHDDFIACENRTMVGATTRSVLKLSQASAFAGLVNVNDRPDVTVSVTSVKVGSAARAAQKHDGHDSGCPCAGEAHGICFHELPWGGLR